MTPNERNWRGSTIYRKCACLETAFDAVYGLITKMFEYRCRNCRCLAKHRARVMEAA